MDGPRWARVALIVLSVAAAFFLGKASARDDAGLTLAVRGQEAAVRAFSKELESLSHTVAVSARNARTCPSRSTSTSRTSAARPPG